MSMDPNTRTGALALMGACAMLGLGYAAVPLYDLFCRVTGFGGTTQVATKAQADRAAALVADRVLAANGVIGPGLLAGGAA